MLSEEILFLSSFLVQSKSSRERLRLFIVWNYCYCFSIDHSDVFVRWDLSFFLLLCSFWVILSMHQGFLQYWPVLFLLIFLTLRSLSVASMGSNALWIVKSFIVPCSICLLYIHYYHPSLVSQTKKQHSAPAEYYTHTCSLGATLNYILF